MKRFLLSCVLVFGLIGCLDSYSMSPNNKVVPSVVATQFPIPINTLSSTMDSSCLKREKECAIAKSLGFHINAIASFSPDSQWVVVYNTLGLLRFIKATGDVEWSFSSSQIKQDIGECAFFWEVNFWSDDSRYVYFSPDPSYCSRPINYSAVGTQVLYRLDVQNGEVVEVLPFKSTSLQYGLYTFKFSPDGKSLAYFQTLDSPVTVKIRELSTGHETFFPLNDKYHEAGCLVWTTDNAHIIFYAAKDTHPGIVITSSLFMRDIRQEKTRTIYSDLPNIYCPSHDVYDWEQIPKGKDLVPVSLIGTDLGTNYYRMIERFYLNPFTGERVIWSTPTP